jgi:uncharacterized GH25 family protein
MVLPAAAPALADAETVNPIPSARIQALMIKVTNTVEMGQPVTITVSSRPSHETIAGAPVYAIKTSGRVGPADPGNYTTLAGEFEALVGSDGILIGTTGSDGTLSAVLTEAGRYLLVATKDGFIPGFARLQVKEDGHKARLSLQAPASVPVGQQVTIKVTDSISGQPVDNATVYTFRTVKPLPPAIRPAPARSENGTATQVILDSQASIEISPDRAEEIASQIGNRETTVGVSNSAGEVSYTFKDPGLYTLLARKDSYLPGARRINIQPDTVLKPLDIKAAFNMTTGQIASIQVTEKGSGQPVAGAAVYSLKADNIKDVKQMPPTANNGKAIAGLALNDADRVREKGILVGNTDSAGLLSYSFPSPGQYILAAFKEGYTAAVTRAGYLPPVSGKALYLKAPAEANAGVAVNIAVNSDNGTAVSGAGVYSVRLDSIKEGPSLLKLLPGLTADVKQKYMPLLKDKSSLSGYTDENGQVAVKFARTGSFLLLAIKDGFISDFTRINILQVPTVTPIPVPQATTTTMTEQ